MPWRSWAPRASVMNRVSVRTQLAMCGQAVRYACKVREWARFTVTEAYISGTVCERRTAHVCASDATAGGVHGQGTGSSMPGQPGAMQEFGEAVAVCIARRIISFRSSAGRDRSGIGRYIDGGETRSGMVSVYRRKG